jgi:tripartite-type tricarboxylate transporter receptor subunit TctC
MAMQARLFVMATALSCVLTIGATRLPAQVSSGGPVVLVVPSAAGGGIDIYGRILAKEFTELGQSMIVENRPGGGTTIGTNYVAKSPPNGRILLLTTNTYTINVAVSKSLPFDAKELTPVTYLGSQPFIIGVNADLPVRSLDELIALAKRPDSKLAFSSCGNLSAQHLTGELLKFRTGAAMVHIPYRGCAPAIADLAGGQVAVGISPITAAMPFIDAGRVRPLALTSAKRSALLPDVPTVEESGLKDFRVDQWWGLFVPAGTASEIIDALIATVGKIIANPEVVKKLAVQGIEPTVSTPEQFAQIVNSDLDQWSKLAKAINLQAD